jgi:hypothetical protein
VIISWARSIIDSAYRFGRYDLGATPSTLLVVVSSGKLEHLTFNQVAMGASPIRLISRLDESVKVTSL